MKKIIFCIVLIVLFTQSAFAESRQFKLIMQNGQKGDPGAKFLIGYAYVIGDGVKVNYREAIKWLKKVC